MINQPECGGEAFDSQQIDKKSGWAEGFEMKTMRVVLYGLRGETVADVVSIPRSRLARGERSFKPWFGRDRRCHRSSLPVVCCWESATEADFGPSRAHSGRASEIITFHDDSWAEVFRKASSAPRALPSAHHLRRVHGAIGTDLAQDANQLAPGRPGLAPYVLEEPTLWLHDLFYIRSPPHQRARGQASSRIHGQIGFNSRNSDFFITRA
jgi:hypothetical protein